MSSELSAQSDLKRLLVQHGYSEQVLEPGVLFFKRPEPLHFKDFHAAKLIALGVEGTF